MFALISNEVENQVLFCGETKEFIEDNVDKFFPQYRDNEIREIDETENGCDGNIYIKGFAPQQPEPDYQEQRVEEYPPMADFLDAQVKINSGDEVLMAEGQAQLDKYVADCLAVKAKYPKPEESIKESVAAE